MTTTPDVDTFTLQGERDDVLWRVTRNLCYWNVEMEHRRRPVLVSSLSYRPEKGDDRLRLMERNHFHDA